MGVHTATMLEHMTGDGQGSPRFNAPWCANNSGREVYAGSWDALVDMTSGDPRRGDICTANGGANCIIGWCWVDLGADHNAANSYLQQKGYECWIKRKSTGVWVRLWGPTTFGFASVWDGSGNRGGVPNSNVGYPFAVQEGGGLSNPGPFLSQYGLEFWPNGGVAAGVTNAALVQDMAAVHIRTLLRSRLINPALTDDRASARFRAKQGWDIGNSARAGWSGANPSAEYTFTRPEKLNLAIASGDYRRAYPGYAMDGGQGRWVLIPFNAADPDRWYIVSGTAVVPAQITGVYGPWAVAAGVGQYTGQTPYGRDSPYVLTRAEFTANPPPDPDVGGSSSPPPVTLTRIMCIGDSQTVGDEASATGYRTYRGKLAELMTTGGVQYDLIGTQANAPAGGGDPHHEGYAGAGIDSQIGTNNITSRVSTILAPSIAVDIVVLLVGIQDVYNATANIGTRYASLVTAIRAAKPSVKVLCVTLPPVRGSTEAQTDALLPAYATLNTAIRALASGDVQVAEGATVSYVIGDYQDTIHFLQAGADKLGQRIHDRLDALTWIASTAPSAPPEPTPGLDFDLRWQATDVGGLSWVATTSASAVPVFQSLTLPAAALGQAYSAQVVVAANPAATLALAPGSPALPTGMSISSGGLITATSVTGATVTVTLRATSGANTADQAFLITVTAAPVWVTESLPNAAVGSSASTTLVATGAAPVTYAVTAGALNPGRSLDPATGIISGSFAAAGTANFEITATGSNSQAAARSFTVVAGTAPNITTTTLPELVVGVAASIQLQATGDQPITWGSPLQQVPAGMTLSTSGLLSGTPTTASTGTLNAVATNLIGTDTQALAWMVVASSATPRITSTTLPAGTIGAAYSGTVTATGAGTITRTVVAGALPPGVSMAPTTGALTGTPTQIGTFAVTLRPSNGTLTGADVTLTIVINAEAVAGTSGGWSRYIRQ
jgi:hypothetical protein